MRLVRPRADPLRRLARGRRGRGGRADGPQRRGQVDDHEGDRGAAGAARRDGPLRWSRPRRPAVVPDRAARTRLGARGPAHLHRPHGSGEPRGRPPAAARRCAHLDRRDAVRPVPEPRRDAAPPRRPDERRRAADADGRAHADGQPAPGDARRAVRGRRAGDRRADGALDQRDEAPGPVRAAVRAEPALRRVGVRPRLRAREGAGALRRLDGRARRPARSSSNPTVPREPGCGRAARFSPIRPFMRG